jgi:hypothetical protein
MIGMQPSTNITIYTAILPNALIIDNRTRGHTLSIPTSVLAYYPISILENLNVYKRAVRYAG